MAANKYHRLNEVLSNEQKERIRNLMCFDPWDDNSKQEYMDSLAENLKKYKSSHLKVIKYTSFNSNHIIA